MLHSQMYVRIRAISLLNANTAAAATVAAAAAIVNIDTTEGMHYIKGIIRRLQLACSLNQPIQVRINVR